MRDYEKLNSIYLQLKGISKDSLTRAETNILKILEKYEFNSNNEVA